MLINGCPQQRRTLIIRWIKLPFFLDIKQPLFPTTTFIAQWTDKVVMAAWCTSCMCLTMWTSTHWKSYFMCPFDWVIQCPDIWPDISGCVCEGVSVRVLLDEISIWSGELSKADGCPQCGWASFYSLRAWIEPKDEGRKTLAPPAWFQELRHQSPPVLFAPSFQAFRLRLNYTTSFPGSPACRWQILKLLCLRNCMTIS